MKSSNVNDLAKRESVVGAVAVAIGKERWVIPDGYLPEKSSGDFPSHESTCVVNTGLEPANLKFEIFFEDRDPLAGFTSTIPGRRTKHIRLDLLVTQDGQRIPRGVPYAIVVTSDRPVVIQHSRMDTSQEALTLMTTMAYPV